MPRTRSFERHMRCIWNTEPSRRLQNDSIVEFAIVLMLVPLHWPLIGLHTEWAAGSSG